LYAWGNYEAERLNVRNGIALSRLHDAAFDVGLITFDGELRLKLSKGLKPYLPQKTVAECFAAYEGEPLRLPKGAVLPDEAFLAVHRAKAFEKWT
jgi:putative restriction endonuclease